MLKVNDWVACLGEDTGTPQIAKVKYLYENEPLADLIFYSHTGERLGRVSPAMGGPKGFEPACGLDLWVKIEEPKFEMLAKSDYCWAHLLKEVESP